MKYVSLAMICNKAITVMDLFVLLTLIANLPLASMVFALNATTMWKASTAIPLLVPLISNAHLALATMENALLVTTNRMDNTATISFVLVTPIVYQELV